MDSAFPQIEINIDDLAAYIFKVNLANPKWMQLDITGLENPKDLFCMCLDLFCKGMVLLHGSENRVYVDDLNTGDFRDIARCMHWAGIRCHLSMQQTDEDNEKSNSDVLLNSLQRIQLMPDHMPLNEYSFSLKVGEHMCNLHFTLFTV
jgi:hypothetical protein